MLSKEASIFSGITILTVPTIMWGGAALLGMLTHGEAGLRIHNTLSTEQMSLFRAGHAHAGVWIVLSLVIQVLLDSAALSRGLRLLARFAAPLGAVTLSGSFFGLAFNPSFSWLLYGGAVLMAISVVLAGIGLIVAGVSRSAANGGAPGR